MSGNPHNPPPAYGIGVDALIQRWLEREREMLEADKLRERSIIHAMRRELQEATGKVVPP